MRTRPGGPTHIIEQEHRVTKLLKYLPAEGKRKQALIQFVALHGGIRTVPTADLIVL